MPTLLNSRLWCILPLFCAQCVSAGVIVRLNPAADTSLMEAEPTNNNGAQTFLVAGVTQNGPRTRALMRFDVSSIPTNAVVQNAGVWLSVTHKPADGYDFGTFSLHRMLTAWGEGTKTASPTAPGQGEPATAGEATWSHAFWGAAPWSAPGGASGVDYSPWESAYQIIYGISESPFLFDSTTELIADVQGWIWGSISNCGWMLLCSDEQTRFTARRFGSREDAANAPALEIRYVIQPVMLDPAISGGQFTFWFLALPSHTYYIEEKQPEGNWNSILTVQRPVDTEIHPVLAYSSTGRLYRLRVE